MKNLILSFILLTHIPLSAGVRDGGGGAGLEINGKYYTFAEIGIEVLEEGTELPRKGLTEAIGIVNNRVYPAVIFKGVKGSLLAKRVTYRRLKTIDAEKYNRVKTEYEATRAKLPALPDDGKFVVFAYSWRDPQTDRFYTDLYPEFFDEEKFSTRQQALTLIHEARIRNFNEASLEQIVNVDSEAYKIMKLAESGVATKDIDLSFFYKALVEAKQLDKEILKEEILKQVLKKQSFNLGAFADFNGYGYAFSAEKLLLLQHVHPLFYSIMKDASIYLKAEALNILDYPRKGTHQRSEHHAGELFKAGRSAKNFELQLDSSGKVWVTANDISLNNTVFDNRMINEIETDHKKCESAGLPWCVGELKLSFFNEW